MRLLDQYGKILLNSSGARETGNGSGNYSCCCGNGSGNCSNCASCYNINDGYNIYNLTATVGCNWADNSGDSINITDGNWTITVDGEIFAYNSLGNGTCPPEDGWTSNNDLTYTVTAGCPCSLLGNCSTCPTSFLITWFQTANPSVGGNATIILGAYVLETCSWYYQGSDSTSDPSVILDCGGFAWGFRIEYSPADISGSLGPNLTGCPPTGTYVGYQNSLPIYTVIISMPMMMRPPENIDNDFDIEKEKRRLQQGGCCGGGKR